MKIKTLDRLCIAVLVLCVTVCIVVASFKSFAMQKDDRNIYDISEIETRFMDAFTDVKLYDSDELTGDILVNRKGMVIERCIGVVENERGDGRVLNCSDPVYNYISYNDCNIGFSVGDIILTYLIYDPLGCGEDDIIERYDYNLTTNAAV